MNSWVSKCADFLLLFARGRVLGSSIQINLLLVEQTEPVPRWEFCTATLQRFTGFGLMALFENNTAEREPVASMVSETTASLHLIRVPTYVGS